MRARVTKSYELSKHQQHEMGEKKQVTVLFFVVPVSGLGRSQMF